MLPSCLKFIKVAVSHGWQQYLNAHFRDPERSFPKKRRKEKITERPCTQSDSLLEVTDRRNREKINAAYKFNSSVMYIKKILSQLS